MHSRPAGGAVLDRAVRSGPGAGTVALLNSLGTTLELWDDVVARLRESFDIVRCDQRGHGRAPLGDGVAGIDVLVDDFLAVLDRFDIERVHLAGVSIGGMVAIRAAARAPERVSSLTVLCSAAVYEPQGWIERARAVRQGGLEPLVPFVMDRWFTAEFRRRDPEIVAAYADMLRSISPEAYAVGCDVLAAADVRGDLPRVSAPTVVVGGARDIATPPDEQRFIARSIPGAGLEILPGVGHLAPAAAPAEVARIVAANASGRRAESG
ncbi:alpha/beta fold hydrolase [Nocardia carnea]|uniref:alpha/beta fold hydrolase n=1 Tax=Nocardia carnea TaxID=37328 RepID=UPI0024537A4D|nr:alpha/beta fold hydrolase [Nocardia carnea]